MSVEDVLNYKPSEEEDFYGLLGCDESASVSGRSKIFGVGLRVCM